MLSSSVYHLYNSLSRDHYNALLKLDLIGIGLKINGLALSLIYTGFHNFKGIGDPLSLVLGLMMASNLLLQFTPCYMQESFSRFRLMFYIILILCLLMVAIIWAFLIASSIEINLFLVRLSLSFGYIGIGFGFWHSGFPERVTSNYWIQMAAQGHVWWHMFTFMNGYTLYWLLYDALKHVEFYGQPGSPDELSHN